MQEQDIDESDEKDLRKKEDEPPADVQEQDTDESDQSDLSQGWIIAVKAPSCRIVVRFTPPTQKRKLIFLS